MTGQRTHNASLRAAKAAWMALSAWLVLGAVSLACSGDEPALIALPQSDLVLFNPDAAAMPLTRLADGMQSYSDLFREQGLVDFRPRLFRHREDLERYFSEIDSRGGAFPWVAALHGGYLLQRGFRWGYEPLVCAVVDGSQELTYSLIVRRDSPIQRIEQAKGAILAMNDLGIDVVDWFNVIVFRNQLDLRTFFRQAIETDSPASTVSAVLFRQAEVGIVPRYLLEAMTEASSRIWKEVREISISRPIMLGGVALWAGAPAEFARRVRGLLTSDLRKQVGGPAILDAFLIDGLADCSWEDLDRREGRYLSEAGAAVPDALTRRLELDRLKARWHSELNPPAVRPQATRKGLRRQTGGRFRATGEPGRPPRHPARSG
ncbi:MAG: PhnD/SsuA/transferrin family substrate-binding protein [Candidatus Schekmanbacteria bacterium]|nr:PhnD/SsuA/transferrin family substrate-binding protein [Candidatus Schekmanbacteria bacterium]